MTLGQQIRSYYMFNIYLLRAGFGENEISLSLDRPVQWHIQLIEIQIESKQMDCDQLFLLIRINM